MNKILLTGICFMTLVHDNILTRDGCTEIGQACICSNTKLKGYCFPSLLSSEKELYCDCQSDVLSESETAVLMSKKYKKDKEVQNLVKQFYPETEQLFKDLLRAHSDLLPLKSFGKFAKKSKLEAAQNKFDILVDQVTQKMALTSKKNPTLASLFFNVFDYCSYYGEPCRCSNTRMDGICAVDRTYRKNDFYCHCGG